MAMNFTSDVTTALYASTVGNDANYQSPGNFAIPAAFVGGAILSTTITGAGTYAGGTVPTFPITDAAGSGASLQTVMKVVGSITVSAAGTGYLPGNTVTLAGGTNSITAILNVPTVKGVTAVVNAAGTGYAIADTITLAGGTFTTASRWTVASAKAVSAVIHSGGGGSGYAVSDTIVLAGGTRTTPVTLTVATLSTTAVATVTVSVAGNYTVLPSNGVAQASSSGAGTGASFDVTWGALTVTVDGSQPGNYTVVPAAPVSQGSTSGSGTGVTLTPVYGVLTATINTAGKYTVTPTSAAAQASSNGSGTGATFTQSWGVDSINVLVGGDGYTTATLAASSGAATATTTLSTDFQVDKNMLTLIELMRSYFAGLNTVNEAKITKAILMRMLGALKTGPNTFSAATIAANMQRRGMRKFAGTRRSGEI